MRVFLDASVIIYLVESVKPFEDLARQRLNRAGLIQVCAELSRLECRVKPLREAKQNLLTAYDDYFNYVISEVIPLSHEVVERATEVRARYGFKTPDALQLAAAIESGCDIFLTNDQRLNRCTEIRVEVLT